jgi:hypothetical protein
LHLHAIRLANIPLKKSLMFPAQDQAGFGNARFLFFKAKSEAPMKTPDPFSVLKDIKVPLFIAFMGCVGGIMGSLIGPSLVAKHEKEKSVSELRVAAYNKFFAGQAKLLQVRYPHPASDDADRLMREYEQEIKEARFKIGVFGSPEVIEALVHWFTVSQAANKSDPNLWTEDVKIYQAMRKEILGEQDPRVEDHVLYDLLFNYKEASLH